MRELHQWQQCKREHEIYSDTAVVIVRMGDNYVTFEQDAVEIARLLQIDLGRLYDPATDELHDILYLTVDQVEQVHQHVGIVILMEYASDGR